MAVRTICKTRRAICIQGALVATGPHRGTAARAQGHIATQQREFKATSRHSGQTPGRITARQHESRVTSQRSSQTPAPHRNTVDRNSKRPRDYRGLAFNGGPSGTRTLDLGIKSPLLYQLS